MLSAVDIGIPPDVPPDQINACENQQSRRDEMSPSSADATRFRRLQIVCATEERQGLLLGE